jgi:hypothetical protein
MPVRADLAEKIAVSGVFLSGKKKNDEMFRIFARRRKTGI